jgi:hypothetical protein
MFPESCHLTADGILVPSSGAWSSAGIATSHGEFWMLNLPAWTATLVPSRNAENVSSLQDILEMGTVPQRYFLSAKACAGILRRAARRGKELPTALHQALQAAAGASSAQAKAGDKIP